jgi:hypothetical protein
LKRFRLSLVPILLLSGCYYHQSGDYDKPAQRGYAWRSLYREDIQTVSVPVFVNRSYTRGVEFSLTAAVVKQLEANAPYKVVSNTKADTILEGEIVAVRTRTVSQGLQNSLPQEQLSSIQVNFTWKDLRNGKILTERRNFEQAATFYPTLGEGRFVGQQEAVERLALAIVQELQADW